MAPTDPIPSGNYSTPDQSKLPLPITYWSKDQVAGLGSKLGPADYYLKVKPLAQIIEKEFGIYYKIPMIQSAHESDYGNSPISRNNLNLFGIIATDSWIKAGRPSDIHLTDEFIKGKWVKLNRGFRVYSSWMDSFRDWANIISTMKVYKTSFELMKKGEGSAIEALAGMSIYALDPNYTKLLVKKYVHDSDAIV